MFWMLLLLLYTIIVQSMAQNMRSIKLSQMNNIKYECASVGCLPSTTLFASNLRRCQMACLAMIQCRTASFYQSTKQCDLFTDIPDEYGSLLAAAGVVTVTAIDSRRLFPRPDFNWLINGNAEQGPCDSGSLVTRPTTWNYNGLITQLAYNTAGGYPSSNDPGPSDRGNCYFCGGQQAVTSMWQTVNMTQKIDPSYIDNQLVRFNISAWLGGFQGQDDNAMVSMIFFNQFNQSVGSSITLGPVLAAHRASITGMVFRQTTGLVPIGARSFKITVTMTRVGGASNDGYADNIAVNFYQS